MMQMGIVSMLALAAAVLSIIELGMTAYLVDAAASSPSHTTFMLFNSIWTLVVIAYFVLIPMHAAHLYNKMVSLALNAITMLFWFAGSIAMAVRFRNCDGGGYCGTGKAATVFGFLLWLIFLAMLIMDTLDWTKNRHSSGVTGIKGPHAYPGA